MDYEEKLEVATKSFAEKYKISEKLAKEIVSDLDIENIILEVFEDDVKEAEENKKAKWEQEIRMNPDIYGGV